MVIETWIGTLFVIIIIIGFLGTEFFFFTLGHFYVESQTVWKSVCLLFKISVLETLCSYSQNLSNKQRCVTYSTLQIRH